MRRLSFLKILANSAALIILPVCVVLLLNYQIGKIVEKLCMDNYISLLKETTNKMDEKIRTLDNWVIDMQISTDFSVFSSVSPKQGGAGIYPLYLLAQKLKSDISSADDICLGYQIISRDNELIYHNNSFVNNLEFFFERLVRYPGMTFPEWRDILFADTGRFFLPAQEVLLDGRAAHAITYVIPLEYGSLHSGSKSVVSILIDAASAAGILETADPGGLAAVCIYTKAGERVFSTKPDSTPLDLAAMPDQQGFFESGDGKNLIACYTSAYNGLIYTAQVPKSFVLREMDVISGTTRVVLLYYLAISVVLALIFAYRTNKPIRSLIASIMDTEPEIAPELHGKGEFDFIASHINKLLQQKNMLAISAKDKLDLLADIAMNQLLTGQARVSGQGAGILEDSVFPPDWSTCRAAVLRMPETEPEEAHRWFGKAVARSGSAEGFTWYSHAAAPSVIAIILLSSGDDQDSALPPVLSAMDESVYICCGVHPYIGVGCAYDDIYDIQFSYDQALYASGSLRGRAQGESPPYLYFYDNAVGSQQMFYYPIDLEYRLVNCVKSGDVPDTMSLTENLIDENFHRRSILPRMQRQLCYDVRSTLLKVSDELRLDHATVQDLSEKVGNQTEDPYVLMRRMQDLFCGLAEDVNKRKRSHNDELRDNIMGYLHERYADPEISVGVIAERFNLSESYLSHFFKIQTGEMISGYIERLRIENARAVIEQDPSVEVEALSRMVGYSSSATFRRAFKRVVGLSPSGYKMK